MINRLSINETDSVFFFAYTPGETKTRGVVGASDSSSINGEHISIYKQAPSLTSQLHTAWAHNCAGEIMRRLGTAGL